MQSESAMTRRERAAVSANGHFPRVNDLAVDEETAGVATEREPRSTGPDNGGRDGNGCACCRVGWIVGVVLDKPAPVENLGANRLPLDATEVGKAHEGTRRSDRRSTNVGGVVASEAADVAAAMVNAAMRAEPGIHIYHYDEIRALAAR